MSRIGKHSVTIPDGVEVDIDGQLVTVKGKLGTLSHTLVEEVEVSRENGEVWVKPRGDDRRDRAMWGMSRTMVQNMVTGVSEGYTRKLEINGVGYRAALEGKMLNLQLGYSHEIKVAIPDEIKITCEKPTEITIFGADRQQVGQIASDIRRLRKPEPYKGKGIKYAEERILRKEGKKK